MAKTARKESEEVEEVHAPDFQKAIRIIRQDVRPAEENSAEERGRLSGAWKAVEKDCHVNKAAAKLVHKLMDMSPENRDDFLRSQYGMMLAANIGISRDLVDAAEGKAEVRMPVEEPDGSVRQFTASDAEFEAAGNAPGITGDALPDELKASAAAGVTPSTGLHVASAAGTGKTNTKPAGRKRAGLSLVTVPDTAH